MTGGEDVKNGADSPCGAVRIQTIGSRLLASAGRPGPVICVISGVPRAAGHEELCRFRLDPVEAGPVPGSRPPQEIETMQRTAVVESDRAMTRRRLKEAFRGAPVLNPGACDGLPSTEPLGITDAATWE